MVMYKHDWVKTTSTIPSRKYVCVKCCCFTGGVVLEEESCRFYSKTDSMKYNHMWGEDNKCIKCGWHRNLLTHSWSKMGEWGIKTTKITPCKYTNDEWDVKNIIE